MVEAMTTLRPGKSLSRSEYAEVRTRLMFEFCKWDPQMQDVSVLLPFPLIIDELEWRSLERTAVKLYHEVIEAENEVLSRRDLHKLLGFPRSIRRALAFASNTHRQRSVRVMRFDFHPARDGWRISEVNSDVPGGFVEVSGLNCLMAPSFSGLKASADVTTIYTDAIADKIPKNACIALVHATAYTDDRQVMLWFARQFERRGFKAVLAAPDHIKWRDGKAIVEGQRAHALLRFYPGEWLPNFSRRTGWHSYFASAATLLSNPATALVSQSKRLPLLWDRLETPMSTWKRLLPETRDPRDTEWRRSPEDWLLKPALGRVGEDIAFPGLTREKKRQRIQRSVRWHPGNWIAQRRFDATSIATSTGPIWPSLGLYVIDGIPAGAYMRVGRRPIIDARARETALLIEPLVKAEAA